MSRLPQHNKSKKVSNHHTLNSYLTLEPRLLNEMSKSELSDIEMYVDKVMNPIDITFTYHFLQRLTDPRNDKQISKAELISFFKKLSRHKKEFLNFIQNYSEFVVKYDRYLLNIPFVRIGNQLVAKTIMRKKGFKTPNPKFKFESYYTYLTEMIENDNKRY